MVGPVLLAAVARQHGHLPGGRHGGEGGEGEVDEEKHYTVKSSLFTWLLACT